MLTPKQAYEIASQWGSYMNASDPGAIFYSFHVDDGRPNDEAHRQALKDAVVDRVERLWGTTHPEGLKDGRELLNLWRFWNECELRP